MINVVHFGLSNKHGGIESDLYRLYSNWNNDDIHFSFIDMTGKGMKPCFYDEFKEKCDFYSITPRRESLLKNYRELNDLFKSGKIDILHFHVNTLSFAVPIYCAVKNGCKVIVNSTSSGVSLPTISSMLHRFNKFVIRRMNVYRVAVSHKAANWMYGSDFHCVINNGVDERRFAFNVEKRRTLRSLHNADNELVICNVGNFIPEKNHTFLIEVFKEIKKKHSNSVLWLVGDGNDREIIEQEVEKSGLSDHVIFWGSVDNVEDILSAADVFVFPSTREGYPNAVLEAQCAGLPCIVSDSVTTEVAVTELVDFLRLDNSAEEWAETILSTATKDTAYREEAYKNIVSAGYSVRDEIKKKEKLYYECLD